MLPKQTPERVVRAHQKITPTFEFLAQYEQWLAEADDECCDFALGNPQTMPLEGFVTALRDATTPQSPDWYAYKMTEPSSREIIQCSLLKLTQQGLHCQQRRITPCLKVLDKFRRATPGDIENVIQNQNLAVHVRTRTNTDHRHI